MAVAAWEIIESAWGRLTGAFTMRTGPGAWGDTASPAAGDLIVIAVEQPGDVQGAPPGWTQNGDGVFYRIAGPGDLETATLTSREPRRWKVRKWLVKAGTYQLPGDQS